MHETSEADLARVYDLGVIGVNRDIVESVDFEQLTETVRQFGLSWLLLNEPAPSLSGAYYTHVDRGKDWRLHFR